MYMDGNPYNGKKRKGNASYAVLLFVLQSTALEYQCLVDWYSAFCAIYPFYSLTVLWH